MMRLPDPIERAESSAENWHSDNVKGDIMTCGCGNECRLDESETLSPDPYAIPVCPSCFDKAMTEKYGDNWKDSM